VPSVRAVLFVLLGVACERARAPDPKPLPPPRDAAVPVTCALADDRIEISGYIPLRFHGKAFAYMQLCPNAMPIFVRDGGTTARVGTSVPGAKLPVISTTADALALDLGAEPNPMHPHVQTPPHLQPFVRRADAAGCTPVKP
jgi:hypothetical protein